MFACRNVIVLLTWNVRLGFGPLVICCALAAGSTHARGCIILFRPTLSLVQSWSEPDGRCVNFVFVTTFFVSAVFMPLIATHNVISSLTMFLSALISLSLLCLLVISTPFSTSLLTVVDRIPLMYLVNHLVL